ncbi:MAG: RIP metalloprotease RseP [Chitinophagales bacterium]|nr:RIP metalloprotease RseP [Chitinophagales bacterium]
MEGLIMTAQLILGLSILVTLHELGHYLAARAFGIKVEKFYLFFDAWGIKLFKFQKGDTEYGVGWLPLGGYVKIAGMIDESLDKEQMKAEPEPWEFRAKPAWQRLIVMVAGVTMNIILGIAIFSASLLHYEKQYLPKDEVKDGIVAYKLGYDLGLRDGDKITEIDGKDFERFNDLLSTRVLFGATLTVKRDGETEYVEIPDDFYKTVTKVGRNQFIGLGQIDFVIQKVLEDGKAEAAGFKDGDKIVSIGGEELHGVVNLKDELAKYKGANVDLVVLRDDAEVELNTEVTEEGTIGISYNAIPDVVNRYNFKNYTIGSALKFGTSDAVESLVANAKGLGKVFSGEEKATDSIQGPIGIAKIYGPVWDWRKFWAITGLLSMILAFMNILPIPALDGGHVIFLLIETFTRKKFSDNFMEKSQIVGMVILISLMAFAFGNDIWKHWLN